MQDDTVVNHHHWASTLGTMLTRCSTPARKRIMSGRLSDSHEAELATSTRCVRQTISFYDIPAELRNVIYELAMPNKDDDRPIVASPCLDGAMILGAQSGIACATRQTRAEALAMFYANNIFEAYIEGFDFRQLIHFVKCVTSGPSPPKIHIHLKLLNRMTCYRGLLDFACAWRQIKHHTVNITVHSCFFDGSRHRIQSTLVAEAINTAERRAAAGDNTDRLTRDELQGTIYEKTHLFVGGAPCMYEDHCTCQEAMREFASAAGWYSCTDTWVLGSKAAAAS